MKLEFRKTLTRDWEKVGIEKPRSVFRKSYAYGSSFIGYHPGQLEFERPIQNFVTGSGYEGVWNALGFSGYGTYFFPHGSIYQGNFIDGQCHGKGLITYPSGDKMKGIWHNGKLINHTFIYYDGLEVTDPWKYCQMPDRRFQIEFNTSLKGPGEELLTNKQPTVEVPEGCYDTIDGFYVPSVKCIFSYTEPTDSSDAKPTHHVMQTDTLKRTVLSEEGKSIEKNYRTASLKSLGYRPDLYEFWITGKAAEVSKILSDMAMETSQISENDASGTLPVSESIDIDLEFEII